MVFFFRIVFYRAPSTGIQYITEGPIFYQPGEEDLSYKILNDAQCLNETLNICASCDPVLGCFKFEAPEYSMYYFEFSAPMERRINMNQDEWAKISVLRYNSWTGLTTTERVFYHFVHNNSTGHFEASFHLYVFRNEQIWLYNHRENTIFVGPRQNQIEFRVYQYTPTDVVANDACTVS